MRLADDSVPKKNPARDCGNGTEEGEFCFCPAHEGAEALLAATAGKLLIVTDGEAFSALAPLAGHPRAMSAVLDGADALPLFAMPEGVGAVFAAGGKRLLLAARRFAAVRNVPCTVAPADAACFGAFERRAVTPVGGVRMEASLPSCRVLLDVSLMGRTLADAVGRLALARLAEVEARALAVFGGKRAESGFPSLPLGGEEDIVRANARLRLRERGAETGEGAVLADLYTGERLPAWRAFCELSALYAAFFSKGKPRKYRVPNYAARRRRAGTGFFDVCSPETYAHRAVMLEKHRAELLRGVECVLRDKPAYLRSVCAFSGQRPAAAPLSEALRTLPEHCPAGLSAIIRDFGLLEDL